ncbi:MAG: glycosyltransferase [Candidatus Omnitrophota bacterium]|jgi:glycosyltransferase involved in cell wall biosynthesis|nr:MAG: glycosyltransferase [Candidatus Omnitrophota bacterium]
MPEVVRLKICFVSSTIYPLYNPLVRAPYGGAEAQIFEIARFFGKDEEMEISVVTGNYEQQEVEFYSGVLVYRADLETPKSLFHRFVPSSSAIHKILKKVDAQTYIMSGACGLTKDVAEFCVRNNRSFVYRISHQRDCDGSFVHGNGEEGERFQWALHHAHQIICQTETQKNLLQRTEQLKAQVIPNVIPLFPPSSAPRDEIIWVGQAVEWKQPELFLRLALTLPNHNFTMIVMPRDLAYLERLVEKTRNVSNLGFENSAPYQEMPACYENAKLLVNTSRFEGFPYSFTQALAAGVPIAALNVDPDGILEHKQMGVCARGSEVRLAQAVNDLLSFERQWKSYSRNAMLYVEENQSFKSLETVYRKLFMRCYRAPKR